MTGAARRLRVLVVGPVPPPFSGKNVAIETLLAGRYRHAELLHVNAAYSKTLADMGRARAGKLLRVVTVLARALWARGTRAPDALMYFPAGADRAGILRDLPVLLLLRPLFEHVVLHLHARGLPEAVDALPRGLRGVAWRAYRHPDVLLAPSQVTIDEAAALGPARALAVGNGTPGAGTPPVDPPDGQGITILFLNLVSEAKGAGWLLEAVADLHDRGHDVRLRYVGELSSPAYGAELRAAAATRGIADRVVFAGLRTGAAKWAEIDACDVFCVPSTWPQETFGLVLIEAASRARPVVAADVPGVREVLDRDLSVLFADPSDRTSLVRHLEALCVDPARRRAIGAAARAAYEARYTVEHHWEVMDEVFGALAATADPQVTDGA